MLFLRKYFPGEEQTCSFNVPNTELDSDDAAMVNFFDWTSQEAGRYSIIVCVTDATGYRVSYSDAYIIT